MSLLVDSWAEIGSQFMETLVCQVENKESLSDAGVDVVKAIMLLIVAKVDSSQHLS